MPNNASPTILLTRPADAAARFAATCRGVFGDRVAIVIAPLVEIVPVADGAMPDGVDGLIFTSEAGVSWFADHAARRDLPAWCVGDRTARAARAVGLTARSAGGDAETLIAAMRADAPGGRWLHLHGQDTRGDVAARLRAAGIDAVGRAVYAQRALAPEAAFHGALAGPNRAIAPLFSPLAARRFADALDTAGPVDLVPVALSVAVRDALPDRLRGRCVVADAPTAHAMLARIATLISP